MVRFPSGWVREGNLGRGVTLHGDCMDVPLYLPTGCSRLRVSSLFRRFSRRFLSLYHTSPPGKEPVSLVPCLSIPWTRSNGYDTPQTSGWILVLETGKVSSVTGVSARPAFR